jgi:hypothetical protein
MIHTKIKDHQCPQCDSKFSQKGDLTRHIKMIHTKIKDFECPSCDFKCSHSGNLKLHIKQVHTKIKDHECPQCDFKCSQNSNLNAHIKQVHTKIKDFKCDQCTYKCSANGTLNAHIKQVHTKIKDFKCNQCEYECSQEGNLKAHIKQVHNKIKDFKCPSCTYKCSQKSNLTRHISICTGELNCSSGELAVIKTLDRLGHEYAYDECYNNVRDKGLLRFDFRLEINEQVIMIEYDGGFHFEPIRMGNMTDEEAEEAHRNTVRRDKIKDDYCEANDIPILRIPYWEKENTFELIDAWMSAFV